MAEMPPLFCAPAAPTSQRRCVRPAARSINRRADGGLGKVAVLCVGTERRPRERRRCRDTGPGAGDRRLLSALAAGRRPPQSGRPALEHAAPAGPHRGTGAP